jgi:hypothetical protein
METHILNICLSMIMDRNADTNESLYDRLTSVLAISSQAEFILYKNACENVEQDAYSTIYNKCKELTAQQNTITEQDLKILFKNQMLSQYDWLNTENLQLLYQRYLYSTWRDGLTNVIVG